MGWGTHEKELVALASSRSSRDPRNQICLAPLGMNTLVALVGAAADHKIIGMVIRHGEAFSISE